MEDEGRSGIGGGIGELSENFGRIFLWALEIYQTAVKK
jgi:hypothetical protein